jgi:hypothetical protein
MNPEIKLSFIFANAFFLKERSGQEVAQGSKGSEHSAQRIGKNILPYFFR